jgi:hypothetical protein
MTRRLAQAPGEKPGLGSESAQYIDLFALQASRNPDVKVRAHDVRDTLPKIRPYKGR